MKAGHKKGDIQRTVVCNFCGEEHRRKSKELRACRRRHRQGKPALATASTSGEGGDSSQGTPSTLYENDPLKGNKRAHLIAKRLKSGMEAHKVAKVIGVSVKEVKKIKELIQ